METVEKVLRKALSDGLAGKLDYYSEYIDVTRSTKPDYQEALRDFLLRKYERPEFNLIIPVAEAAIEFVAQYRAELFPGSPVVFLGSGEHSVAALRLGPNSTGLSQVVDMRSTLDLARKLQPGTKQVFVFSGASKLDRYYEGLARRQFQEFEGRLAFTYLRGQPLEDLQKTVANLPHDSIIYFLSIAEDGAGRRFIPIEALDKMSPMATVPIYGWIETQMDHGILGGSLLSPEILAHHLAKLALRVLSGEKPSDIPVTDVNANANMVDWRQLQRWGISEGRLPPGSIVRFKEPTLWERYKSRIVAVISLCIFQALLIVWLLIHRNRRRRAEEAKDKLAAIVESSHDAILSKTLEGTITSWNAGAEKIYGYSASEIVGQPVSALAPAHLKEEVPRILESIRRGESVDHLETVRLTKDGRRIDVSLTISPIKDGRGRIIGASTIARDIMDRKRNEKALRQLSGRLLMLQDEERQRVAAELHDGLGQSLAMIKNRAMIGLGDQTNQDQAIEQLEEICATAASAIREVREIAHNLRPYELDRLGLVPAIESMIERVSASTSINLSTDLESIEGLLSPEAETSVYRIVQEGLNNVLKHSHATAARIEIKKNGQQLAVSVQDNGKGMPPPASTGNGNEARGFGLAGIAERVRLLGGSLAIDSEPARGTTLTIRLELPGGTRE